MPPSSTRRLSSIHFETIKSAIPQALIKASPLRRAQLKAITPLIPDWYANAPATARDTLKADLDKLHALHNKRDALFNKIRSIEAFAKDLLEPELSKLDASFDADGTWIRLYAPKALGLFGLKSEAHTVKTFSLLQAALHNFEADEIKPGFHHADSCFISKPDERGHFEPITTTASVDTFTQLCRRLNIGEQYQTYLKSFLRPDDNGFSSKVVRDATLPYDQQALKCAAQLALLKKDIEQADHDRLMKVVNGEQVVMEGDKQLSFRRLSIMGLALNDCVLFVPCEKHRYHSGYLIAWIPEDPEHPLKRYSSFEDFRQTLTARLTAQPAGRAIGPAAGQPSDYQLFFSRFVAQKDRPYYFRRFTEQATDGQTESFLARWSRHELVKLGERLILHVDVPDRDVAVRRDPQKDPNLNIRDANMPGKGLWEDFDLWSARHAAMLDRMFADARVLAVPDADQDARARSERWSNYLNIGFNVLGAFAMVIPGLGELMLAVMAGQILYEAFEGAIELSQGDREAGWAHITDVIENLATAAALAPVFHYTVTPFIEKLKAVALPGGKTRLWNSSSQPYRFTGNLPPNIKRVGKGLISHEGKTLLRVAEHHYVVQRNPQTGEFTIPHPSRADAYPMPVRHNGAGSYVLPDETPSTWDDATLMRRLGYPVESFDDVQCEQIRKISGTSPDTLRRMYHDNAAPPPLLTDAIERFALEQDVRTFREQITSDDPTLQAKADPALQLHIIEAEGLWPDGVPLRVIDRHGRRLWQSRAVNAAQGKILVVELSDEHLAKGRALNNVLQTLDANDTPIRLDGAADSPLATREEQLRARIASTVKEQPVELFNQRYKNLKSSHQPAAQQLQEIFPDLPAVLCERLLGDASHAEFERINQQQHVPLRLKNIARELQFETRASHAWQGLDHPWLATADTERLALNTLRLHSDALAQVRIEIREGAFDGLQRCEVGAQDADTVRVLVRNTQQQYELYDAQGARLQPAEDFYQAILQALPAAQRQALGYRLEDGTKPKQWIMAKSEAASERRTLLAQPPVLEVASQETVTLLGGPGHSKQGATLEARIQDLYPNLSESERATLADAMTREGNPLAAMDRLEQELDDLHVILNRWQYENEVTWGPAPMKFRTDGGRHIIDRLKECFARHSMAFGERSIAPEGGYTLNLSSEFLPYDLEYWWAKLPDIKPWLDQITTLSVDNIRLAKGGGVLFEDFPHLRQLSARKCGLKGLPPEVARMRLLETLRLSDNQIELTPHTASQLKDLTRLQTLRLDDNPLGLRPDVGRMPRLSVLSLNNTGLTTWPDGLFSKARPRQFFLNMLENPISEIPEMVAGSDDAFLIARTRLLVNELSDANRLLYEQYRRSAGMSPEFVYASEVTDLLRRWPVRTGSLFNRTPGLGTHRPEAWHDLASEPNSKGFFKILENLSQSADYIKGGAAREQLGDRVWRMIDAIDVDTRLREDLFDIATAPVRCRDAGAQVFNEMGIRVMAAEARLSTTSREPLERKLATLAKGAARLERVNEVAQADVQARDGDPDVVEVYLAYQTALAKRLDLPWQSQDMLYRPTAGVGQVQIDEAFDTVIALEAGDGLVNAMLEQPFWSDYLRESRPGEFYANKARFETRSSQLDDVRTIQAELASPAALPGTHRIELQNRLRNLARELSIPLKQVLTGRPMEEALYDRLFIELADQEKELSRQQTRDVLQKFNL